MKPIYRNDPNIPLDINESTVAAAIGTVAADSTTCAVAGVLSTSTIVEVFEANSAGALTSLGAIGIAYNGGVVLGIGDATSADELVVVFSNQ